MVLSSPAERRHELLRKGKFQPPVSMSEVKAVWKNLGYSCNLFHDPPGKEWNDFMHRDDEVIVVVRGKMRFQVGSDEFVLDGSSGDELFIPAGLKHSTKNVGVEDALWLYGYG